MSGILRMRTRSEFEKAQLELGLHILLLLCQPHNQKKYYDGDPDSCIFGFEGSKPTSFCPNQHRADLRCHRRQNRLASWRCSYSCRCSAKTGDKRSFGTKDVEDSWLQDGSQIATWTECGFLYFLRSKDVIRYAQDSRAAMGDRHGGVGTWAEQICRESRRAVACLVGL